MAKRKHKLRQNKRPLPLAFIQTHSYISPATTPTTRQSRLIAPLNVNTAYRASQERDVMHPSPEQSRPRALDRACMHSSALGAWHRSIGSQARSCRPFLREITDREALRDPREIRLCVSLSLSCGLYVYMRTGCMKYICVCMRVGGRCKSKGGTGCIIERENFRFLLLKFLNYTSASAGKNSRRQLLSFR